MGIKKIFLTLFLLATFLIPVAFAQAAACTIREERTSGIAGVANTPACSAKLGETKSDDSKCQNIKPTIRYGAGGETIREVCCCTKESGAAVVSTVPKFKVPELQIELPGLKFTQPNCAQGENGEYTCEVNWLGEYITWIYNYALKIAGILAAVMLMAGGLLWLVSAGDAGKVGQAKEIMVGSVVGLIILMSSYVLLVQVNPNLIKFRPITLGALSNQEVTELIKAKESGGANSYLNSGCATDDELKNGTTFYATGYCRPTWADTKKFFCAIAINCSCPDGVGYDTSQNCDEFFTTLASQGKHYSPCNRFEKDVNYCNLTASGEAPYEGSIAGPIECSNLQYGDKVCFNNRTYTINDKGGLIKGKRIDIWTGDCSQVSTVSGAGTLTKGACDTNPSLVFPSTFVTTGWSFDPGIINQAGDASPELGQLLNCMRGKLPNGVGVISSISDSNYIGNLTQCNKANCASPVPCAHSCGSCHYGGGSLSTNKSYAVDFGDEGNIAALTAAARACDSRAYILDEGNHLHVSSGACPRG